MMGFRWRKSFSIFPGFRLNLSHRGTRGQLGGSPLSFSFRLFGGSKQRRVTASLPGTGLSFVATSTPDAPSQSVQASERPAADLPLLFREALTQAAQMRLIPLRFDQLLDQPAEVRRDVVKAAVPLLIELLRANGATQSGPLQAPEAVDEFDDAKIGALLIEVRDRTSS